MATVRNRSFAELLWDFYLVSRKPLAIILVFVAGLSRVFSNEATYGAALTASALLALNILFDIHKRILGEARQQKFSRFHDAAIDFRRIVEEQISKKRVVKIKWLGMSMEYGAPLLDDMISSLHYVQARTEVELIIAMLDPDWSEAERINPTWPKKGQAALETFKVVKKRLGQGLKHHEIKIKIYLYRHVPNWHGFSVNDKYFYLGSCSWHGERLLGGENPYALAVAGSRDEEDACAKRFLGWFEFCRGKGQQATQNLDHQSGTQVTGSWQADDLVAKPDGAVSGETTKP